MKILDAKAAGTVEGGPTYSLKNRAFRGFWSLTWFFLAAWTPAPANRWRLFLLSLFGAKIAPEAFVYGSARVWYPPHFEAGRYARISPSVTVYCVAKITVADYAIVSQGSTLCTAGHDIQDPHFQTVAQPITIGPQAWVAAEAFVGPGVTVGEGAVLGARGCTFRDLEPWTVYAGNPARKLKLRKIRMI
ncbi:MAG TPA: putative colanic acid biosynthesis acetyltransferase [Methylocella sp.]|nr:putative colanic acid biosynthesis acetyltransferase [Methylocella sp.]